MDKNIGKIEIVPIREAFPHEALHLTRWLEENIEALSVRLGLDLTVTQREKTVGDFHVDLLCEDIEGRRVIIENQLEKTDHDHLGKVLTYLVNLDAQIAIWVTTNPRPEHQRVIDWLNENTGEDIAFYLVKVEAIRIEGSPYAPLFTVLAQPDIKIKEIGASKKELTEHEFADRHYKRIEFWTGLLEKSKALTRLGANKSPAKDHWLGITTGISGIAYNYLILKDGAGVDLYIDVGAYDRNKLIFDALYVDKEQIESEFGAVFDWRRLDDKRASRIVHKISTGSLRQQETWDELQSQMIEAMIKLDKVLRNRLQNLRK